MIICEECGEPAGGKFDEIELCQKHAIEMAGAKLTRIENSERILDFLRVSKEDWEFFIVSTPKSKDGLFAESCRGKKRND